MMTDEEERALMDKASQIADRICEGHKKLWHAWDLIRGTPEPKQVKLLQDWDRAVERLHRLASELIALGGACVWETPQKLGPFESEQDAQEMGSFLEEPRKPCLVCPVRSAGWSPEKCLAWGLEL